MYMQHLFKHAVQTCLVLGCLSVVAVPGGAEDAIAPDTNRKLNVAVLLYDSALLLDYGIAAEMFLAADFMRRFDVYTVAHEPVVQLSIVGRCTPNFVFDDAPVPDVVVVPGGMQWLREATDPRTVRYLSAARARGAVLYSVCTGSLLLAKAGLLRDRPATTNAQAIQMLAAQDPSIVVVEGRKFVDSGGVLTAAGSGSAIEATLYLIAKLVNPEVAQDLALRYLDYRYGVDESLGPGPSN